MKTQIRQIPLYLYLSDETLEDYHDASDDVVIEAFKTYYGINRKDFNIQK